MTREEKFEWMRARQLALRAPSYLTPHEAVHVALVPLATVYRAVRDCRLTAHHRPSGRIQIHRADLKAWMKNECHKLAQSLTKDRA